MTRSLIIVSLMLLLAASVTLPHKEAPAPQPEVAPLPPDTGTHSAAATPPEAAPVVADTDAPVVAPAVHEPDYPQLLSIPSLALKSPIIEVGLNDKGEMDVPSGATNKVGWYQYGTVPGDVGSAVIDAHVFAAFAALKNIKTGSSVYVKTAAGKTLHFVVSDVRLYALAAVPGDTLFNRADATRLNLITCAGKLTPDHKTYDHRLVVYAVLAGDA